MLPEELQERREQLQRVFHDLSGSVEIVPCDTYSLPSGEPVVRFKHNVRIRTASIRLLIYEEFRDIDSDPHLYAFSYHIASEKDLNANKPLFRYECHPDVGDTSGAAGDSPETVQFKSPYERQPHFHPDKTTDQYIHKLHFPFHRAERKTVVFALVSWLRVDLIRRFYHV